MQFCLVRCDGFQFFGKQFPCCLLMVSSWLEPLTVAIVFLYSWMYLSQLCPRRLHNQSKFCFLATIAYTNIELSHNCHLLICVCLENQVRCIEVNIREECVLCSQYNRQCSCVQFHLYLLAIYSMWTYALHQVDVTSEFLYSWWFALVQSNNKQFMYDSSCNIGFVRTSFWSSW